ncbi:hypothetical protein FRB96_005801 [Tulasnella sp. 330]|nr:hypothetical protein FRB96_005801 [Tulasnella sp. 330]
MASIKPPFTLESAKEKLKFAQAMWNTRDPSQVAKGYTADCTWRNRDSFIKGTEQIIGFLSKKWEKERSYRLRKELFCFQDDKIAVQFWYEYQDASDGMKWKRCYGLEDWTYDGAFDPDAFGLILRHKESGKMKKRMMSGNDLLLGKDGDGVGVPEEGIEGRWFVDGVNVDDVELMDKHY